METPVYFVVCFPRGEPDPKDYRTLWDFWAAYEREVVEHSITFDTLEESRAWIKEQLGEHRYDVKQRWVIAEYEDIRNTVESGDSVLDFDKALHEETLDLLRGENQRLRRLLEMVEIGYL